MRGFQFTLDKLLRLREAEKKQQQLKTAKAYTIVEQRTEQVANLGTKRAEALRMKDEPSVVSMQLNYRHRQYLTCVLKNAQDQLHQAKEEHARQQEYLREATKDYKVLVLLRDRQKDMHRRAMQRREQQMLDEFASFARVRQERG
ncbi:MAG TPA: hypothetical protein GXX57_03715 [Firmicutes bacterium]|jgi:flagellar export protein FliJ|nr:hypothetical protein [Bacillota bacterium]